MTHSASGAAEGEPATLELAEVSLRRTDAILLTELSLRSTARCIGLVGTWEPLFLALTGTATVSSGSARIFGCEVHAALAGGVVGFAPCDPPLPASFSVREYLEHAARLSYGTHTGAQATAEARRILEEFGLNEHAQRTLAQLAPHQVRALGIVAAALAAPPVLCLETPLRDLDVASAEYVARLCLHAAERSRVVVSTALPSTPSPERALLDQCEELFLLQHGVLVAAGPPEAVFAPCLRYLLTLSGPNGGELKAALGNAGCELTQLATPSTFSALLPAGRRVTRYLVELPPAGSSDLLLDMALATGVSVLELEPLFNG